MHSWLVKSLDRLAIRAACRSGTYSPPPAAVEPLDSALLASALSLAPIAIDLASAEFQLDSNGRFQFRSPIQTAAGKNNRVYGQFFRAADNWERYPTVILLHGWNAELCYRYLFPHLAARLARAKVNSLAFELPYHMQRRPQVGPVRDFISSDLGAMLEATRQAIADVQVLCRWLESRDAAAIGLWGFSLGAWLTGLVCRFESALACAVLTTPIARLDRAVAELAFCAPIRSGLGGRAANLGALNLASIPPLLDPCRVLLVASQHDLFAPRETIEELWEAWGHPNIWRPRHGHISVLASAMTRGTTVQWIAQQMGRQQLVAARR